MPNPGSGSRSPKSLKVAFLVFGILLAVVMSADAVSSQNKVQPRAAAVELGQRLFNDPRLSSPDGDLVNSCNSCHLQHEDPQGYRVLTDFFNRSWVPWRKEDPRRSEVRNSPTILDAELMPRLHFDGEFTSLEDLVTGTLSGRPMGWLPGEESRAFDHVFSVLLAEKDARPAADATYRTAFKRAYDADIDALGRDRTMTLVARAMSDYMRTFRTSRATPYDRFVAINGLPAEPGAVTRTFGQKMLEQVTALDAKKSLKFPEGFDAQALRGMRVFFTTNGDASVGNCVVCHSPPYFSDFSFHNMGVSQAEYDSVHGEGRFSALAIPDAAAAKRPAANFREVPSRHNAGLVDLGFWNFVDLKSPLRRANETDDQFLRRMIGTFKTPSLRNLAYSYPYLHTGSITTVEETLAELRRLSDLARRGLVREADEELAKIRISDPDISALAAFLKTLNDEVPRRTGH
jgi:cytochrome c peroxidase